MDTTISKTSRLLFCLCLINSSILMPFLAFELVYNMGVLTFYALDGAESPQDILGVTIALLLPFARFYTLLLLFAYRIKSLISPPEPKDLPAFKISFFTHRIVQTYPNPALRYYLIILLNAICTIYFLIVFKFSEIDIPLERSWFPILIFWPFSLIAIFYDTQFLLGNVYYSFILNIFYLIGGIYKLSRIIQPLLIKDLIIIALSLVFFLCYTYRDRLIKIWRPG